MKKNTAIFYLFLLSFLLLHCDPNAGKYQNTNFRTQKGGVKTIPGHCLAWDDGCKIYCRTFGDKYEIASTYTKCIDENIVDPICIHNREEVDRLCGQNVYDMASS